MFPFAERTISPLVSPPILPSGNIAHVHVSASTSALLVHSITTYKLRPSLTVRSDCRKRSLVNSDPLIRSLLACALEDRGESIPLRTQVF